MSSLEKMYQIFQPVMGAVDPGLAMETLENIIASWPDLAIAHNDLAVFYYNEKEMENALNHYQEAARLQPNNTTFLKNLADFYYVESRNVEEALKLYVKVIEINS